MSLHSQLDFYSGPVPRTESFRTRSREPGKSTFAPNKADKASNWGRILIFLDSQLSERVVEGPTPWNILNELSESFGHQLIEFTDTEVKSI